MLHVKLQPKEPEKQTSKVGVLSEETLPSETKVVEVKEPVM